MDQQFSTPMMKQYEVIKKRYKDCLLLYRMGDFYELFLDDAHIGAKVLDITLTSRAKGKDGRIPMAGVPYHAVDSYLAKLVKAGYKVAICEQMTEPNKKGIIEREVVRVVTPGTILDEKALDKKENNFIVSILIHNSQIAIAACDISTGYFQANEVPYIDLGQTIKDELGRINPVECILSEDLYQNFELLKILRKEHNLNITCYKNWDITTIQSKKFITHHFKINTLEVFGLHDKPIATIACAALIGYLKETQKEKIDHIKTIQVVHNDGYLLMDKSTMLNLELFTTIREHDSKGTLVSVLDQTITAMGGRLLRFWIRKPLINTQIITGRYDGVDELLQKSTLKKNIRSLLEEVADIERMIARLSVGIGNARDLINLQSSLQSIIQTKQALREIKTPLLKKINADISPELVTVIDDIKKTLLEEPPVSIREGGMIKENVNKRLDHLRSLVGGGKEWIAQLEIEERKRTGIGSLKVRYNKVFGFYIEVSKANAHLVPSDYMRKQTLVNGERFITQDLKKQEEIILSAEDEIHKLEYSLFQDLLSRVLSNTHYIQSASAAIATLDCLVSFAVLAEANQYTRPELISTGEIYIKNGRHPVVERLLTDTQFVPNDVTLNTKNQQLLIITGPNMAGKSVLIRQVAIIVLMAQIGAFVPADCLCLHPVDHIFVRSGAADVITGGLSTFMVEMVETAYILNHATENSLIIMDEIGRGTSTYDGISIAWAVAEYLVNHEKKTTKTLFATHYHELQELESRYPEKIINYRMAVVEEEGMPVFLHTLLKGGASASFGVAVAQLAGVPQPVIEKATYLLQQMEKNKHLSLESSSEGVINDQMTHLYKEIKSLDIHKMTPLDALNMLAKIQEHIK